MAAELKSVPSSTTLARSSSGTHRVILDTDIGTDVDDAYALAVLAGADNVEIRGITTVYGDPVLRARLTSRLLSLLGESVGVYAGEAATLSGAEPWMTGEEGRGYDQLETERYEGTDGVTFLVEEARRYPGAIEIVAVGPLTNLARAVALDPDFASRVRRVWIMGGRFDAADETEHNFRSDAVAAHAVFTSGLPITVVGVELTREVQLRDPDLTAIGASGPFGAVLERDTRRWMARWDEDFEVPHDAVACLMMLDPASFETEAVHVTVDLSEPDTGGCRMSVRALPNVDVVRRFDAAAVAAEVTRRVCAASARSAQ